MLLTGIYLSTIMYSWLGKNRKRFWIWCILLLILIVNTSINYADYKIYETYYKGFNSGDFLIGKDGIPVGWYYLCIFFGNLGLTYNGMIVVILACLMIIIHLSIKKFPIIENIFWGLFIIFPGLIQCVQLRFFLGTTIVFCGLISLLNEEKNSLLKYIISVIIAYFFHASCMIFLIFCLIPLLKHMNRRSVILVCFILAIFIYFGLGFIPKIVSPFLPSNRLERYFESNISKTTFSWFIQIISVWGVCCFTSGLIKKYIDLKKIDDGFSVFANNSCNAISLLLITLPFLGFDRNFHRFIEIGYMILFILIAYYWKNCKLDNTKRILLVLVTLAIMCVITYIYTPIKTVITPFFTFSGFHELY